jgi:hypothetical protein
MKGVSVSNVINIEDLRKKRIRQSTSVEDFTDKSFFEITTVCLTGILDIPVEEYNRMSITDDIVEEAVSKDPNTYYARIVNYIKNFNDPVFGFSIEIPDVNVVHLINDKTNVCYRFASMSSALMYLDNICLKKLQSERLKKLQL